MDNLNLEFIIDKERDSDELDDIRTKLFKCLLGTKNVYIKKYNNFYNNTILLNFVNENDIIKLQLEEKLLFLKFLDMFQQNDIFISCDKEQNQYMKILFGDKIFTTLKNIFMYCKGTKIDENKRNLITRINNILDSGVGFYDNKDEVDLILNLRNLKKVKINNVSDICKIFDGKIKSHYFLLSKEYDKYNIESLKQSRMMRFPYLNNTVSSRYYLAMSLLNVGKTDNLPDFSLKKLLHNINNDNFFESFSNTTYVKICNIKKEDTLKIKNFNNLEDAIGFNIMLTKKGIHGILIPYQKKFNICFTTMEEIEYSVNLEEIKKEYLKIFSEKEIKNYNLEDKNLYFLSNIVKLETGELITPDNQNLITLEGNLITIDMLQNRNLYCYNIFNDLMMLDKKHFKFDRNKINIDVDIDIEFIEKIDFIYSLCIKNSEIDVILQKDIFVDGDVKILEEKVKKLWNKGYFLTDYAIYRYGIMGILKNQDIKFPDWFISKDGESYEWLNQTLNSIV